MRQWILFSVLIFSLLACSPSSSQQLDVFSSLVVLGESLEVDTESEVLALLQGTSSDSYTKLGYIQDVAATNFTDEATGNVVTSIPTWRDTGNGPALLLRSVTGIGFFLVTDATNYSAQVGARLHWDARDEVYASSSMGVNVYLEYSVFSSIPPYDVEFKAYQDNAPITETINTVSNIWGWNNTQVDIVAGEADVFPVKSVASVVSNRLLSGIPGDPGEQWDLPMVIVTTYTNAENEPFILYYLFDTNGIDYTQD